MSGRVVLLTSDSWAGRAMARRILDHGHDLVLIVREDRSAPIQYSAPSRLARGLFGHALVDRIARLRLSSRERKTRAWEQEKQRAAQVRLDKHTGYGSLGWPSAPPIIDTTHVNRGDTVAQVKAAKPDVLVVFGTGLLRQPLIDAAPKGAINAHSSILPHYRGLRPEFWQCLLNDPRYTGITIHAITTGIDDGAILFQQRTTVPWPSDPYQLRTENLIASLDHMPRVTEEHLLGRTRPMEQGPTDIPTRLGREVTMEKRMELMELLTAQRAP